MVRPLRIEGAGLWRHVMCRGNGGQHVFADTRDNEAFLAQAIAPAPGAPHTLVMYQPFLGRAATSIWHHAVPRTALPEWEQP